MQGHFLQVHHRRSHFGLWVFVGFVVHLAHAELCQIGSGLVGSGNGDVERSAAAVISALQRLADVLRLRLAAHLYFVVNGLDVLRSVVHQRQRGTDGLAKEGVQVGRCLQCGSMGFDAFTADEHYQGGRTGTGQGSPLAIGAVGVQEQSLGVLLIHRHQGCAVGVGIVAGIEARHLERISGIHALLAYHVGFGQPGLGPLAVGGNVHADNVGHHLSTFQGQFMGQPHFIVCNVLGIGVYGDAYTSDFQPLQGRVRQSQGHVVGLSLLRTEGRERACALIDTIVNLAVSHCR